MLKNQVVIGGVYRARIGGNFTDVRLDAPLGTSQNATNLTTGRKITIKSAAKFRAAVSKEAREAAPGEASRNPLRTEEKGPDGETIITHRDPAE